MIDETYQSESHHTPESLDRDARLVGHEVKTRGAGFTGPIDSISIRELSMPGGAVIGAELVTNSTFDADSDWTIGKENTMTDAPERIWHSIDRKGKINGSPDAHVQPCEGSLPAYVEYVRADLAPSWQPIKTAPKDGTEIILLTRKGICRGKWDVVDFGEYPLDPVYKWWVNSDDVFWFEEPYDEPTHWMPLPAPPAE
jgi:hypothetical protein